METIGVITIIIAAVFVATECRSPPRVLPPQPPHQQNPLRDCLLKIDECTRPLQQNEFIRGQGRLYTDVIDNIESICQDYQTSANCLRPSAYICDENVQNQIKAGLSAGDFVCSDEGRALVGEYRSSVCYSDPMKILEIEAFSEYCVAEAISSPRRSEDQNDRCQILEDIFECLFRRITEECGQAAGRLVEEISNRLLVIITEKVCPTESASDILKRGLDFFSKRG